MTPSKVGSVPSSQRGCACSSCTIPVAGKGSIVGWLAGAALISLVAGAIVGMAPGQPGQADTQTKPAVSAPPSLPAGEQELGIQGERRFGIEAPKPRTPGTIRLATYNVENLFDDQDDPTLNDAQDDASMTKPVEHRQQLAKIIRAVDADILALQEVESKEALLWFRDEFLAGLGYEHVSSIDSGDNRGIECSILSRFPISQEQVWPDAPLGGTHPEKFGNQPNEYAGQPITFRRGPLRATVTVPADKVAEILKSSKIDASATPADYALTLFVLHHKSGRGGAYWRERESAKTLELAQEVASTEPASNIVLLGDFNAEPNAKSVLTYTQAGFIDVFANRRGDGGVQGSALPEFVTHASGRPIDYILVNPNTAKELVPESKFVLGTPILPEGVDYRRVSPPVGYASDHFPVVVDIVPINK